MIWRAIGRIAAVIVGFALAVIAGGATLFSLGFNWAAEEAIGYVDEGGDEITLIIQEGLNMLAFFLSISPVLTLMPAISVAVAGELARINSVFYYVVTGGAATAAMPIIMYYQDDRLSGYSAEYFAIITTAGFVGGFIYWLIAGRNA